MRARLSGERMESESDSVPETACWDVATVGLKFFWRTKKVDSDVSIRN